MKYPTQQQLKKLFDYDGKHFVWKVNMGQRGRPGKKIKTTNGDGYVHVGINGKRYKVHRLIWLWYYGEYPDGEIDHINHDREDNRIENLRLVSKKENSKNARLSKNNRSGFNGVYYRKRDRKWVAQLPRRGESGHLGQYDDIETAISMRLCAEDHYGFHPNHGGQYA